MWILIIASGENHISRGARNKKRGGRSTFINGVYGYNSGDQQGHQETASDYYSRIQQEAIDQRRLLISFEEY